MKQILVFLLSFLLSSQLLAFSKKQPSPEAGIDDWDYNATMQDCGKKSRIMPTSMAGSVRMAAPMMMKKSIGFSTGGAKDADNFYENIAQGYLPKLKAMTYEGVFYDHYFQSPQNQSCQTLFCPNYSTAIAKNPFTQEEEYFLSVGLDSNIKESDFARKLLNIVVVLDISGSMSASFNQYYYDNNQKITLDKEERTHSKMTLANEAIVSMIDHLHPEDRLGVVLFDNQAYAAKPLRMIKNTQIAATKKHILSLKERGGTNWQAGYKTGMALFDTISDTFKDPAKYENRIIFLTDAMPNRGELRQEGLFSLAKEASKKHIYTTFIGIGVDFNNDLVEAVSKTQGANYYAIHSSKEFQKRLDAEFDYMVTPLVFDLDLSLQTSAYSINTVYGSPEAEMSTGRLMYVNTLFPSPSEDGATRGGVILLKLKKQGNMDDLILNISYKDRQGKVYHASKKATFKQGVYHDNVSIQKAILLAQYVELLQNFTLDMRQACHDTVSPAPFTMLKRTCGTPPPARPFYSMLKTWERKSCPLQVSAGYQKIFSLFTQYFKSQMTDIQDDSLQKELQLLHTLSQTSTQTTSVKIDDWKGN